MSLRARMAALIIKYVLNIIDERRIKMKGKPGRPRLPKDKRRNEQVVFYVTKRERDELFRKAYKRHASVSDYVREALGLE